jgi:hypothetical protein
MESPEDRGPMTQVLFPTSVDHAAFAVESRFMVDVLAETNEAEERTKTQQRAKETRFNMKTSEKK